jgi:hypothetical protein
MLSHTHAGSLFATVASKSRRRVGEGGEDETGLDRVGVKEGQEMYPKRPEIGKKQEPTGK